jgi:hypothetical protein
VVDVVGVHPLPSTMASSALELAVQWGLAIEIKRAIKKVEERELLDARERARRTRDSIAPGPPMGVLTSGY